MPDDLAQHVISTGRNGELDQTTPAALDAIATAAAKSAHVVLHFHGGLVDEGAGMATAKRLTDVYTAAGAYPVFFVWHAGALEILRNNLDEILHEDLFSRMLHRVLQFAVGKVRQGPNERAAGAVPAPNDIEVRSELGKRNEAAGAQEPYAGTEPAGVEPLDPREREQLELAVQEDDDLRTAVEEALLARHPEQEVGSRGVVVRRTASAATAMDPKALDEITAGAAVAPGQRGAISMAIVAKKLGEVLVRVVQRFRHDTDHGVYPTVVEELMREFYAANMGGALWAAMKKETSDTFQAGDPVGDPMRGGRRFLDRLAAELAAGSGSGARPRITLVGHSTGAVFIDNLLTEVARGHADGDRPWPDDVRFQVAFLAPACTYAHFGAALDRATGRVDSFRMFTMDDEHEQSDRLVGALYPRSLLHLVSGALERSAEGASAVTPVLGMQRYLTPRYAERPDLTQGRAYCSADRVVLSPSPAGAPLGRRATALKHGDFDDDGLVLESLAAMIGGTG